MFLVLCEDVQPARAASFHLLSMLLEIANNTHTVAGSHASCKLLAEVPLQKACTEQQSHTALCSCTPTVVIAALKEPVH
jgi:hypothetical protein